MADEKVKQKKIEEKVRYVREQKGHSIILHIFLCCFAIGFFTIPYYSISKNHYWHI